MIWVRIGLAKLADTPELILLGCSWLVPMARIIAHAINKYRIWVRFGLAHPSIAPRVAALLSALIK
jgi:hypothetical protein